MQVVAEVPSFESVAERHLDDVHAYLVYLTRDRGAAEDLTAETFEKASAAVAPLRPPPRQRAHLALPDRAHDRARPLPRRGAPAAARAERLRAASPSTWRTASSAGCRRSSSARLRRLSAGEREVIALRVLLDLDQETAARVLGISPTNCATRLSRALKKLEERMSADVAA